MSVFNNHHRHRRDDHHYDRNFSFRAASKQRRRIGKKWQNHVGFLLTRRLPSSALRLGCSCSLLTQGARWEMLTAGV